jgi:isoleucyl-tRNA synthetase
VSRVLEPMRAGGTIGASLQAEVALYVDDARLQRLAPVADELRFFFITSKLSLQPLAERPPEALRADGSEAWIFAKPSAAAKCIRCWHYREDVGSNAAHPQICGRCVENVDGAGETRHWF